MNGVARVEFRVTGGGLASALVATATPTYHGWLVGWDTTTVADGSYSLQSVAYVAGGGAAVPVTVDNLPPSTSVLSPRSGATIARSAHSALLPEHSLGSRCARTRKTL